MKHIRTGLALITVACVWTLGCNGFHDPLPPRSQTFYTFHRPHPEHDTGWLLGQKELY